MSFWTTVNRMDLQEFRPGILSRAELGNSLVMACMEIEPGREDAGHQHSFDQCGLVLEGSIEMVIGDERRVLKPSDAYFIPSGTFHGWKTFDSPVRILDVSGK